MLFLRKAHNTEHPSRGCSPLGTYFTAESTEAMRIKSLAQGNNILMLEFEPSTSASKIDILTTRPICTMVVIDVLIKMAGLSVLGEMSYVVDFVLMSEVTGILDKFRNKRSLLRARVRRLSWRNQSAGHMRQYRISVDGRKSLYVSDS